MLLRKRREKSLAYENRFREERAKLLKEKNEELDERIAIAKEISNDPEKRRAATNISPQAAVAAARVAATEAASVRGDSNPQLSQDHGHVNHPRHRRRTRRSRR